ncbi:hypothetical protein Tco_1142137 [Tanacetum coccineum]
MEVKVRENGLKRRRKQNRVRLVPPVILGKAVYNMIKEVLEKNQKQYVRESTSVPCRVEGSHAATNVVGPSVVRQSISVPCRSQELHVPVNVSPDRRFLNVSAAKRMAGMDVVCDVKTGTLMFNTLTIDKNLIRASL